MGSSNGEEEVLSSKYRMCLVTAGLHLLTMPLMLVTLSMSTQALCERKKPLIGKNKGMKIWGLAAFV